MDKLTVESLGVKGTWREIANAASTTISKEAGTKEPSSSWKRRMLIAEHSPIRQLLIKWKWRGLKYFVSTHFVRHWLGIVHWISTQRDDRTTTVNQEHISRNDAPQGAPVTHECEANAQAIINISRKRLCNCASKETREAWRLFLDETVKPNEPELYTCCVKECLYRGFCPEFTTCGYYKTEAYKNELIEYRKGINE